MLDLLLRVHDRWDRCYAISPIMLRRVNAVRLRNSRLLHPLAPMMQILVSRWLRMGILVLQQVSLSMRSYLRTCSPYFDADRQAFDSVQKWSERHCGTGFQSRSLCGCTESLSGLHWRKSSEQHTWLLPATLRNPKTVSETQLCQTAETKSQRGNKTGWIGRAHFRGLH